MLKVLKFNGYFFNKFIHKKKKDISLVGKKRYIIGLYLFNVIILNMIPVEVMEREDIQEFIKRLSFIMPDLSYMQQESEIPKQATFLFAWMWVSWVFYFLITYMYAVRIKEVRIDTINYFSKRAYFIKRRLRKANDFSRYITFTLYYLFAPLMYYFGFFMGERVNMLFREPTDGKYRFLGTDVSYSNSFLLTILEQLAIIITVPMLGGIVYVLTIVYIKLSHKENN